MSYETKEEILKLGEIDPELKEVSPSRGLDLHTDAGNTVPCATLRLHILNESQAFSEHGLSTSRL